MQNFEELFPKGVLRTVRSLSAWHQRRGLGGPLGIWKSLFRGQGEEFRELREYVQGDDLRALDWSATARTGHMFVRTYDADRATPILLIVDANSSMLTGTGAFARYEVAVRLALVLALLAQKQKDPIGLLIFAGDQEIYLPPRLAVEQPGLIAQKLWNPPRNTHPVDWNSLWTRVSALCPKKHALVLLSDFTESESSLLGLRPLWARHFFLALGLQDKLDFKIPWMGTTLLRHPNRHGTETRSFFGHRSWSDRGHRHWQSVQQEITAHGGRFYPIMSSSSWEEISLGLERILEGA